MGVTVWHVDALDHKHDRVTVFPHSGVYPSCFAHCEQTCLRVTVVHTSTQDTIAALKSAAALATDLGAELTLLWAEEIPQQYALDDLPVPIETLERQLQKVVCFSGVRETQVLTQLLLCRDRYVALPRALSSHSLLVIGRSNGWRKPNRKLEQVLRDHGHHIVSNIAPRTRFFRRHWNWEMFFIRLFTNLTAARRVGV